MRLNNHTRGEREDSEVSTPKGEHQRDEEKSEPVGGGVRSKVIVCIRLLRGQYQRSLLS